jgi:hypothetical protein
MNPNKLFTDEEYYTESANSIDKELTAAIREIFIKWSASVSIRELEYVATKTVTDICLELLLKKQQSNFSS